MNFPGTSLGQRTAWIQFPDGKSFLVIGQNHGDRALGSRLLFQLESLMKDQTGERRDLINRFVRYELEQHANAILHAREELRYYNSVNGPAGFFAIEASDEDLPDIGLRHAKLYNLLLELRYRYGPKPPYPDGFRQAESEYWKRSISSNELATDFFPVEFRRIQVSEHERPELERLARQVVEVRLTSAQRDQATAQNMAEQRRSGLLTIGQLHLPTLAYELKQLCEQPLQAAQKRPRNRH